MRLMKRLALAAALAVGIVVTASAQNRQRQPGGFGFGFGGQGPNVYSLVAVNKDLQSELKITDEQKGKLEEAMRPIGEKRRELFQGFQPGQPPSEEQRKEMAEKSAKLNEETKKVVEGILKPEQAKRLTQISYQAMGVNAFTTKDVQEALKLTDGQKEKIKGIAEEFTKDRTELMRSAFQGFQPGGDREEMQKKMQEMQKKTAALTADAQEKIEGQLKDDQKAAWKNLVGEKFDTTKLQQGFGQRRPRDN